MEVKLTDDMIGRIRSGDRTVIPAIIELHMPLTYVLAKRHCRRYDKFSDLQAEASLALIQATHNLFDPKREEHTNYTAYIVTIIRGKLEKFLHGDHLVPISRDDFRSHKQVNIYNLEMLLGLDENSQYNSVSDSSSTRYRYQDRTGLKHIVRAEQEDRMIVESMLEEARLTKLERIIVKHLLDKRTIREISSIENISKSRIGLMIEGIRGKVKFFKDDYNGQG